MKKFIYLFSILVIFSFLVAGCSSNKGNSNEIIGNVVLDSPIEEPHKGHTAPDFTVRTIDGEEFKLSNYKNNKPVLVYFWATWCPFCKLDLTTAQKIYPNYKDKIEFIAIDLDASEDINTIKKYRSELGLKDIKFAPGNINVLSDYGVSSTTTKFAVGKDGIIIWIGSGEVDEDTWKIIFEGLVNS